MAVLEPEPNDDEVNDIFARMVGDLDMDEQAIVNTSDVVVSSLQDIELIEKFNASKRELYERGELLNPKTDTGRDLHSVYHACLLEMKKRGLM